MNVDLSKPILDVNDQPFVDENKEPVIAKAIIVKALSLGQDDIKDFFKKCEVYDLYKKVKTHAILDLTKSEVATIQDSVGKVFGVLICGQINGMLKE